MSFNNVLFFLNYVDAGYDVLVGLILLSHIAFFFVARTEFLRLKDVSFPDTQQIFALAKPALQFSSLCICFRVHLL